MRKAGDVEHGDPPERNQKIIVISTLPNTTGRTIGGPSSSSFAPSRCSVQRRAVSDH
jgi:hypothetical protein